MLKLFVTLAASANHGGQGMSDIAAGVNGRTTRTPIGGYR
jgi:hypothetical protein